MDWGDTAEQAAFRAEVRAFVEARLPERYRNDPFDSGEHFVQWVFDRYSEEPELREAAREWASALADRGWVAPAWPAEYGGAGLTSIEQFVFGEEMARAHAPPVGGNGVVMLGPTLIVHGSEAQRREVLPRMLAGDYVYAQGYSEPGAGSDLASLATRAERDGDEYVINGQKIWTLRRAPRRCAVHARPHRPQRAQAPRHLLPARAEDGHARHRGAPAAGHDPRALLQRGLLRERARPCRAARRRREPRLVRRHDAARLRALGRGRRSRARAERRATGRVPRERRGRGLPPHGRLGVGARGAGGALDRGGRLAAALAAHRLDAGGGG